MAGKPETPEILDVEGIVAREATRADRPKGNEAQCVLCWRIFGSDWTCERHKPYRKPKTVECKDPASIGMKAIERRGLAIWVMPMGEAARRRFTRDPRGPLVSGTGPTPETPENRAVKGMVPSYGG